jgi:mono/diheme cytochrome c family protein
MKKDILKRDVAMTRLIEFLALLTYTVALTGSAHAQDAAAGKKLYVAYCTTCHGDNGKGDGVAAASLPVKPADHTNGTVMNQLPDKFLTDIIAKGGSAVNRSAFMPAWGSSLNGKQISDLVAYLRSIANPPYNQAGKTGDK